MSDASRSTLCPVLVADLAERSARELITSIAMSNGIAHLPLLAAPVDASIHQLEVYTPGATEPLVVFAVPAGAPTEEGFPFRLRMRASVAPGRAKTTKPVAVATLPELPGSTKVTPERGTAAVKTPIAHAATLLPRKKTKLTMSERHTRDLSGERAAQTPESLVGRSLSNGKLQIDSLIGVGAGGAVFKATHRELRMAVAVKVLHESFQTDIEFCRRFHAEALAASRLDHLNVVRVLDYGQEPDGLMYLAMEYLEGTPLSTVIERERTFAMKRIVDIMAQVCAGLAHAHARQIVHRDVKPDNIVLVCVRDDDDRAFERVKVCDFGIAVQPHDENGAMVVAGTPAYMSPEQCRGAALDGRSDVYACGVILYELATGQVPFAGGDVVQMVNRQMNVPPAKPSLINPEIDPRLEAVIMKALAKDPDARQQTMRELRSELRALVDADVDSDRTPAPMQVPHLGASKEAPPLTPPPPARPASVRAMAAMTDAVPEWLEHGSNVYLVHHPAPQSSSTRGASSETPVRPTPALTAKLGAWLARFAEAPCPKQFEEMAMQLEGALPVLVARRDVRALFAIHSTLEMIRATAAKLTSGAQRLARVRTLLAVFIDPALLQHLAEVTLVDDDREAARLLLKIGTPAAYALYSARLKHTGEQLARQRFIEIVHTMGSDALPMMRAGLAKLAPHHERQVARDLAVDLLLATPNIRDDAAGELAARWAASDRSR